jgi:hypothetical protein
MVAIPRLATSLRAAVAGHAGVTVRSKSVT